ncbi:hypothetical protein DMB66_42645 [Actinoplanes sp. ATCC 53533]|nr:hypothetical protein DMB66_42645 [Actinoplanes sp. ATCC 53533]
MGSQEPREPTAPAPGQPPPDSAEATSATAGRTGPNRRGPARTNLGTVRPTRPTDLGTGRPAHPAGLGAIGPAGAGKAIPGPEQPAGASTATPRPDQPAGGEAPAARTTPEATLAAQPVPVHAGQLRLLLRRTRLSRLARRPAVSGLGRPAGDRGRS